MGENTRDALVRDAIRTYSSEYGNPSLSAIDSYCKKYEDVEFVPELIQESLDRLIDDESIVMYEIGKTITYGISKRRLIYAHSRFFVDYSQQKIRINDTESNLTPTEFAILARFTENPNKLIPRDVMVTNIWGPEYVGDNDILKWHIKNLRGKLGDNDKTLIVTERGIGYKLIDEEI